MEAVNLLCADLNESAKVIFENNKEKGFWDFERNVGEMLMLITSELGEAMEAHRKGRFTSDIAKRDYPGDYKNWFEENVKDTFEDELADAVIRILDMAGGLDIDLVGHINAKVEYNKTRERLHGKKY